MPLLSTGAAKINNNKEKVPCRSFDIKKMRAVLIFIIWLSPREQISTFPSNVKLLLWLNHSEVWKNAFLHLCFPPHRERRSCAPGSGPSRPGSSGPPWAAARPRPEQHQHVHVGQFFKWGQDEKCINVSYLIQAFSWLSFLPRCSLWKQSKLICVVYIQRV